MSRLPSRGEIEWRTVAPRRGPAHQRLRRIVSIEKSVSDHYTHGSLAAAILRGLEEAAGHGGDITSADLAPVDEFHIGGRAASVHLIDQLGFESGMRILDVGSGLGGTARYVAENRGCHVTGIDLTAEYCNVARMLAEKVALADRVSYREGSALEMPFAEEAFDGVYTIHVAMNIADKPKLYREVHRVIRSGAMFGIYDILAGPAASNLAFPVPWAATPETSFLTSIDRLGVMLEEAGFDVESRTDRTSFALDFFTELQRRAVDGPPPLGLHILMGEDFLAKAANMLLNVREARCTPWEIVCRKK